MPQGAILACLIILLAHGVVSRFVYPLPIARPELRQKVLALTEGTRPRLLVAGDSRAAWQLHPEVLADELGWPEADVVNIAVDNCGTTAVLAAYREFAQRFAPQPIMLLSVSIWSVNDGSPTYVENDELLWSLSLPECLRLVSPARAVHALFSAEKALWLAAAESWEDPIDFGRERGFAAPGGLGRSNFSRSAAARQTHLLQKEWYAGSDLDGLRWRAFEADVASLSALGVHVILVDAPMHPDWLAQIQGTAAGELQSAFETQQAHWAVAHGVPLLRFAADWLNGHDPDDLFYDYVHLNRDGATIFSRQVARDVAELIGHQRIQPPPAAYADRGTEAGGGPIGDAVEPPWAAGPRLHGDAPTRAIDASPNPR